MILQVYALWDRVAEEFGQPFCSKSHATAVRASREALQGARADEHALVCLGSFNTEKWDGLKALDKGVQVEIPEVVDGEHIRSS